MTSEHKFDEIELNWADYIDSLSSWNRRTFKLERRGRPLIDSSQRPTQTGARAGDRSDTGGSREQSQ